MSARSRSAPWFREPVEIRYPRLCAEWAVQREVETIRAKIEADVLELLQGAKVRWDDAGPSAAWQKSAEESFRKVVEAHGWTRDAR